MSTALRCAPILGAALALSPGLAGAFAQLGDYPRAEFSPARGETFQIPVVLEQPAQVKITLYTADGDSVRVLESGKTLPSGTQELSWDGRDSAGTLVPDEAYLPVLELVSASGERRVVDQRATSGGATIDDLQVRFTSEGHVAYRLPAPARVLIRAGLRGGPMMRSLANWEPRSAGSNIERWNGMDENRLRNLRGETNLSILVRAFRLANHAIITAGNASLTYGQYRTRNGWPMRAPDDSIALVRDGERIAREHYVSPARARDPHVSIALVDPAGPGGDSPLVAAGRSVVVRVDIDPDDRWLIDESLYEVAFFVDYEFVSEEEQGYLPLTWHWTPAALQPGPHLLTVNVSAFNGKIGVASVAFTAE